MALNFLIDFKQKKYFLHLDFAFIKRFRAYY